MSQAYIQDVVTDGNGKPLTGVSVTLLRASDYSTIPTSDPGPGYANYIEQTTTNAQGTYVFDFIPYDDYHVMVKYQGTTTFKYFVTALPVEVADTKSTHGRVLLPRTLQKLLAGENTVIHFVGDSITVGYNATSTLGSNYVQRMGVLIGQQFAPNAAVNRYDPNAYATLQDSLINGWNGPTVIQAPSGGSTQTIQIVNSGVSGDTIQRVLRRFVNLTGWTPTVDAFFIYLGINDSLTTDATKFVSPTDFYAGMRALIDIIRNYYPQAEIAVSTPHHNDQPDAGNGGTIPANTYTLEEYAMSTRRAAQDMGVALIDLRQSWADTFNPNDPNFATNDGYPSSWLSTVGGNHTHPSDQGHQAIAEEMIKVFGTPGLAAGRPQRIQTLGPMKHFKDLEVVRLPNTFPGLNFAGGHWGTFAPALLGNLYFSPSLEQSQTAGDTMTFTARMQDFALLVRRGADCGQLSIAIDGGVATTFDTYRGNPTNISDTTADGAVYPMDKIWVARGLPEGEHTVVLTVLGTHNPSSSAAYIDIDGIEYTRWGYTPRRLECPQELSSIQYGSVTWVLTGTYYQTDGIVYPKPFRSGNIPVIVGIANQIDHYVEADTITNTGCNLRVVRRDGANETTTVTGQWIAIG